MATMTLQEFAKDIVAEFGPEGINGNAPMVSIETVVQWAAQERARLLSLIDLASQAGDLDCAYCPMPGGCAGGEGRADADVCRAALCRHFGIELTLLEVR